MLEEAYMCDYVSCVHAGVIVYVFMHAGGCLSVCACVMCMGLLDEGGMCVCVFL